MQFHGRLRERARYRGTTAQASKSAHGDLPSQQLLSMTEDMYVHLSFDSGFVEVDEKSLSSFAWSTIVSSPWKYAPKRINIMEARARTCTLRHLLLGDNLVLTCAASKKQVQQPLLTHGTS